MAETSRPGARWNAVARNPWLEDLWAMAVVANDEDGEEKVAVYGDDRVRRARAAHGLPPCIRSIRSGVLQGKTSIRNSVGIPVCSYHASAGDSRSDAIETMRHVPSSSDIDSATASQWNSIAGKDRYRFSTRSCKTLRGLGCACTTTCPHHETFSATESNVGRVKKPSKKPYDWGADPRKIVTTDKAAKVIQAAILDGEIDGFPVDHLITATPGAGKTYGSGLAVPALEFRGERPLYSAPTHAVATDFAALVPQAHVLRPRNEDTCRRHELAGRVAGRGWGAVREVCAGCDDFESKKPTDSACPWWQQWTSDKPTWICTHAHLRSGFPQRFHDPTVVILDEDPLSACLGWAGGAEGGIHSDILHRPPPTFEVEGTVITGLGIIDGDVTEVDVVVGLDAGTDLVRAYAMPLWSAGPGSHDWTMGNEPAGGRTGLGPVADLAVIVAERMRAVEQGKHFAMEFLRKKNGWDSRKWRSSPGAEAVFPLLVEPWRDCPRGTSWAEEPETARLVDEIAAWDGLDHPPDVHPSDYPPNVLGPLVRALAAGIHLWRKKRAGEAHGSGAVPLDIGVDDGTCTLRVRTFEPLEIPSTARVVALDATADTEIAQKCVGRTLQRIDFALRTQSPVLQITDMALPRATIQATRGQARKWEDRIARICEQIHAARGAGAGPLLVITYMLFAGRLRHRWRKDPRFRVLHYGALRGESHMDISAAVLVGYPRPRLDDCLLDAAAIWAGEDLDGGTTEVWRPYLEAGRESENESLGVEVLEPTDPRLCAVWKSRSDAEQEQALHRGRPGRRSDCPTYILTQVPLHPEYRESVRLGTLRALEGKAKVQKTVADKVEEIARAIRKKLGWVSSKLLEAVLTDPIEGQDDGQGIFRRGGYIELLIPGAAENTPDYTSSVISKACEIRRVVGLTTMTPPRFREAWSSYAAHRDPTEVRISTSGRGRPKTDHVVGDLLAWVWDARPVVDATGIRVNVDGAEVISTIYDEIFAAGGPGCGGLRVVIPIDDLLGGGDAAQDPREYLRTRTIAPVAAGDEGGPDG